MQALPNGNLLVTESQRGHAFELTPDKKIVWDYYDPAPEIRRLAAMKRDPEDKIYFMVRYPEDMIDGLLQRKDKT